MLCSVTDIKCKLGSCGSQSIQSSARCSRSCHPCSCCNVSICSERSSRPGSVHAALHGCCLHTCKQCFMQPTSASCSQAVLHAARRVSRADSCPQLAVLSCTDPPVCTAPSGTAGQPCTACCSRLLLQHAELRERAPRGVLSVISSFFCLHVQITRRQHVTAWCCSSAASLPPLAVSPQHSAPIQLHQHRVLSHRCSALPPCVCLHCSTAAALLWLLWSLQGLQQCSAVQ